MNVIFILIAVSLLVAIGFLASFIWSIRSGQYEDEYTPSVRILFDDEVNVVEEKAASTEPCKDKDPSPPSSAQDDVVIPGEARERQKKEGQQPKTND